MSLLFAERRRSRRDVIFRTWAGRLAAGRCFVFGRDICIESWRLKVFLMDARWAGKMFDLRGEFFKFGSSSGGRALNLI